MCLRVWKVFEMPSSKWVCGYSGLYHLQVKPLRWVLKWNVIRRESERNNVYIFDRLIVVVTLSKVCWAMTTKLTMKRKYICITKPKSSILGLVYSVTLGFFLKASEPSPFNKPS